MKREELLTLWHRAVNAIPVNSTEPHAELLLFAALVAAAERERMTVNGIHTCNPECDRPVCVARRLQNRINRLEKRLAAARRSRDTLRRFLRQTIRAFASNGAGKKVREASKNLTVKEILREKR